MNRLSQIITVSFLIAFSFAGRGETQTPAATPRAFIDATGPDWHALSENDFTNVNCALDTWKWDGGTVHCTGQPTGMLRTQIIYTNFELVAEWMFLEYAGNSGIFVYATPESIKELEAHPKGRDPFPSGIEVQVLDHGYAERFEKQNHKKSDWFTTNGDVFPVHDTKMKPFPPLSADGSRSFPRKNLSKGFGQWNHYYVRAINGEIRLWVNGEEVSGGNHINPANGYLCLESEGARIDFKNLRIRVLP